MTRKISVRTANALSSVFKSKLGLPRNPNPITMAAALSVYSPALASSSTSSRFVKTHHLPFSSAPRIVASPRVSNHRLLVSTSRTTTVIPTTGIELENAALSGNSDPQLDSGSINGNSGGGGGGDGGRGGGGGGDGDHNGWSSGGSDGNSPFKGILFGLWEAFIRGWRSRVRTDPQFPFKVLTEEFIGVGACVLGDMATRPNFGLDELDFVFSTVVVGSILNFALMYMLAPTSAGAEVSRLPHMFASCPPGHMFEPGAYTVFDRLGTFVFKGLLFAGAGFAAGVLGTAISKALLDARKKVDPSFQLQNESPPTLLNAATWAVHMGLSSNLRYQALNGVEYAAAGVLNPAAFKVSVFFLRAANNVLGGTSFVLLARLTGSQKAGGVRKSQEGGEDDSSSPALTEAVAAPASEAEKTSEVQTRTSTA